MPLITVFTPAYNRGSLLPRLYESLCRQTVHDFEWLIVDDGSTDDTQKVIGSIKDHHPSHLFSIEIHHQSNGGKHSAINRGAKLAHGKLFFCVDSDDMLTENSIEKIINYYDQIRDLPNFCGVAGMKGYFNYQKVGTQVHFNVLDCSIAESGYKYHIHGDKAEVIRTAIMREYPFPEFVGERFCPEALVWNRISKRYNIRYFDEVIYLCEYLSDGLSSQQAKLLERNPKATMLTYKEMVENNAAPLPFRIKNAINYWRYTFLKSFRMDRSFRLKWYWLSCFPLGIIVRMLKG